MNHKYDCNIILDLLPLRAEQMVSKETEGVISCHLEECEACRQAYEEMTKELDITAESSKRKGKRKKKHSYRQRSKAAMFIGGYLLLLLLILAFCLIDLTFF